MPHELIPRLSPNLRPMFVFHTPPGKPYSDLNILVDCLLHSHPWPQSTTHRLLQRHPETQSTTVILIFLHLNENRQTLHYVLIEHVNHMYTLYLKQNNVVENRLLNQLIYIYIYAI
jgi:hypothetical protein